MEQLTGRLLSCADFPEYKEVIGALQAYDEQFHLVDLVQEKAELLKEHAENREAARLDADAQRRATTFASRLWRNPEVPN